MKENKNSKTILIIEDDASIRDSLHELLESENYNVLLAEHGQKALELLLTLPRPDLILLDLSMPIMDGKTFLKEMGRLFPAFNGLPIVIMTAAGVGEIPNNHARDLILRKPLDIDDLLNKIEEVIKTYGR